MEQVQHNTETNQTRSFVGVLEFVLDHKGNYAYPGWSDREIYNDLRRAIIENLIEVDRDDAGNVCGVVVAKYTPTYKVLHISQLICTNKKSLPYFIRVFNKRFPGWRLTSTRSKKTFKLHKVTYDTERFKRKVLYYG